MARYRDDEENPFAAPESDLAPEAFLKSDSDFAYAGFWARFVAMFVDGIVLRIVGAVVEAISTATLREVGEGADQSTRIGLALLPAGFLIIFQWLYFALQESSEAQATLGKRMLGLRVTDLAGERISFGRATGRYFGKAISGLLLLIGYLMQPFTQRKQALHDIMAGTIVVKGRSESLRAKPQFTMPEDFGELDRDRGDV